MMFRSKCAFGERGGRLADGEVIWQNSEPDIVVFSADEESGSHIFVLKVSYSIVCPMVVHVLPRIILYIGTTTSAL